MQRCDWNACVSNVLYDTLMALDQTGVIFRNQVWNKFYWTICDIGCTSQISTLE